jgi:hypothetical protein
MKFELPWQDDCFAVGMFESMPGCSLFFQDVFFPFGMSSSLSGCFLLCQNILFHFRMHSSLFGYFSVRIYYSLSGCILLPGDHAVLFISRYGSLIQIYIYIRDRLLHCTQSWTCTPFNKGEV